jgi:hypothetical protein
MKLQILAGAAALALIAGGASAAPHKSAGAYAEPSQPVAYTKLDSYLKTSPTKRARQDWSIGASATASAAPIGGAANTAATAPQTPTATPADSAAMPPPAAQAPPDQMAAPAAPAAPASPAPATPGT